MVDKKITDLDAATTIASTDIFPVVTGVGATPVTQKTTKANLVANLKASAAQVTTGTDDTVFATPKAIKDAGVGAMTFAIADEVSAGTVNNKAIAPDAFANSVMGYQVVEAAMNGADLLTTTARAYIRVPAKLDGWRLAGVSAQCRVASTSGIPTFSIKYGTAGGTLTSMLTTNLTIDANEFDSSTAATPAVIDGAHNVVYLGQQIEIACSVAGTGVTYVVIELIFIRN